MKNGIVGIEDFGGNRFTELVRRIRRSTHNLKWKHPKGTVSKKTCRIIPPRPMKRAPLSPNIEIENH